MPESVRCRKCGKLLFTVTIPTEVKGTIRVQGGSIDNKCSRCGELYKFGMDELLEFVFQHQKTVVVERQGKDSFSIKSELVVPFELLNSSQRELMEKIWANPSRKTELLDEYARLRGGED